MYSVKRESGAEICRGCLSTDRRLSPLANYDLFFTLLNDKQKLEALNTPAPLLCWECNASLRRMKLFQTQAQQAYRLLEQMVDELLIQGLSQLSISHKQDYDVIIEDCLDCIEEPLISPIKDEEIKVQIEELDVNSIESYDHDFEDSDNYESNDRLELEEPTTVTFAEEIMNTPLKKSKRKLKIVKQSKTKIKRKRFETDTNIKRKSNRAGLRSSGEIVPPMYPNNKNYCSKKEVKTKIRVNNTIKNKIKKAKPKTNKGTSQIIVKVNKENKTPASDADVLATKDLQNELVHNKAEANTESDLEKLENAGKDVENPKERIETGSGEIEQNNNLSDVDSQSDPGNDDSDYEEKLRKHSKITNTSVIKKKGVVTNDSWSRSVCLRFSIVEELDEYFTKVDLSAKKIKDILDNELSYESEELPYNCNYCGLCFQLTRVLIQHKRERHKQIAKCKNPVYLMYRCNICDKTVRKEHTEAHMKYLHRVRHHCKECDQPFWDKEEGKNHYIAAHKDPRRFKCDRCGRDHKSQKALESHTRERHTRFTCDVCNVIITGVNNLKSHKRYRHESDDSAPELRYCVTCDKQFLSVLAYEAHLRHSTAHRGTPPERVSCTECGKTLRHKLNLRYHYDRYHAGKTKFHCSPCNKYFARQSGLRGHNRSVHLKVRAPKDKLCSICGRGFSTFRNLKFHIRTHTGERPHACPHCPAAFAQPWPLRKHLETQHGEAPKTQAGGPATLALGP